MVVAKVRTSILWVIAGLLIAAGTFWLLVLLVWISGILFGPGPKIMVFGPGAPTMWLGHFAPALLVTLAGVLLALRLRLPSLTSRPS